MSRVKRQHFVPQFYLRRFAIPAQEGRIWVYDKPQRKRFAMAIKDVASQRGFYDVADLDLAWGQAQALEKLMGRYDTLGAAVLQEVLGPLTVGTFLELTVSQREQLSVFLAMQFLRTDVTRETITQSYAGFAEQQVRVARQLGVTAEVELQPKLSTDEISRRDMTRHALHMLNPETLARFSAALASRCWVIVRNETDSQFITSDHPLVLTHENNPGGVAQGGIERADAEVVIPLSPGYLLMVFAANGNPNALAANNRVIPGPVRHLIDQWNCYQVISAKRHLYSSDGKFELVDRILDEKPVLGEPNRQRVRVGPTAGGGTGDRESCAAAGPQ